MMSLLLTACIGMSAGFLFILRLSPAKITEDVFCRLAAKPKSIRADINEATMRRKKPLIRREIDEARDILRMTGREEKFPSVCALSLLLFSSGAAAAAMMGNLFLIPVLSTGMMFVPFWYVRLSQGHYKKAITAELETALSIITSAYLRNEDIQTAAEENLGYLNPPVLSVFRGFLARIRLVDPDVTAALAEMKMKIENEVFHEWCDALAACRHDRSLKTTLTPIVAKLSDMRIVNGELENLITEPRKEFIIMQILLIGNIPLMYFLNKGWFETLMYTPLGQVILSVCAAVLFVTTAFVIRLTRPIEYRR
jgi:Flp pilus assembly protein TadB